MTALGWIAGAFLAAVLLAAALVVRLVVRRVRHNAFDRGLNSAAPLAAMAQAWKSDGERAPIEEAAP